MFDDVLDRGVRERQAKTNRLYGLVEFLNSRPQLPARNGELTADGRRNYEAAVNAALVAIGAIAKETIEWCEGEDD